MTRVGRIIQILVLVGFFLFLLACGAVRGGKAMLLAPDAQPNQPIFQGEIGEGQLLAQDSSGAGASAQADAADTDSAAPEASQEGAAEQPSQEVAATPTLEVTPTPPVETVFQPAPEGGYTFGTPLGETARVEDTWFANAAFIGDSRTEGLQAFSGLKYGDFLFARGMNVFRVDDPEYRVVHRPEGDYTVLEALGLKEYTSVYIMIGVNELGYPEESYREGLGKLVARVKEIQPGAVVYLQTMPPVNDATAAKNGLNSSITNARVDLFNQIIIQTAQEQQVMLLDTACVYRGADGQLPPELTSDGVHFAVSGYGLWAEYLRTHAISQETYGTYRSAAAAG